MKKKEGKEKAKARNEEIGTNERAVAHPPISAAQVLLTSPVHTTPPAPLMHCTKTGIKSSAFLRQTGQCQWPFWCLRFPSG